LLLLESSSHYPGETAIRIDSYPAGGVFPALTQAYLVRAARITFSTTLDQFAGPSSAAPQGPPICQGQDSNLAPWSYAIDSPHILATNRGAHSYRMGVSGLSCTRRLRGRNDLSGQLSVRFAFNMTQGRTVNRSLTDTDGDRFTPKTSMPCCCTIVILSGLIHY